MGEEECHGAENTSGFQTLKIILEAQKCNEDDSTSGSDDRGSNPGGGWEFFSSTPCPDLLWGPQILLPSGYRGSFPGGKAAGA